MQTLLVSHSILHSYMHSCKVYLLPLLPKFSNKIDLTLRNKLDIQLVIQLLAHKLLPLPDNSLVHSIRLSLTPNNNIPLLNLQPPEFFNNELFNLRHSNPTQHPQTIKKEEISWFHYCSKWNILPTSILCLRNNYTWMQLWLVFRQFSNHYLNSYWFTCKIQ